MTETGTPAEERNDKSPAGKPWKTPHFAELASMRDTRKPGYLYESPYQGNS